MKYLLTIFLLFPFFFTIISLLILKKIGFSNSKALGFAADMTTPFLVISLPIIVKSIWEWRITAIMLSILLVIAIIFTFLEWRSQKEIDIPQLLKKLWRAYFLLLSMMYIVLMIVGFVYWVINYI
jgi:hypothetical protein